MEKAGDKKPEHSIGHISAEAEAGHGEHEQKRLPGEYFVFFKIFFEQYGDKGHRHGNE